MGIELELGVLLAIAVIGPSTLARFEGESPAWRKILKWTLITAGTLGLYTMVGHWALALPLGLGLFGLSLHFWWCRRHGIHPLTAMPRRRYYELRGWTWPE
jgi:hypothetical protein